MQIEGNGPAPIGIRNVGTLKFSDSNWNTCHYQYVEIQIKFHIFYSFLGFICKGKKRMPYVESFLPVHL